MNTILICLVIYLVVAIIYYFAAKPKNNYPSYQQELYKQSCEDHRFWTFLWPVRVFLFISVALFS